MKIHYEISTFFEVSPFFSLNASLAIVKKMSDLLSEKLHTRHNSFITAFFVHFLCDLVSGTWELRNTPFSRELSMWREGRGIVWDYAVVFDEVSELITRAHFASSGLQWSELIKVSPLFLAINSFEVLEIKLWTLHDSILVSSRKTLT